MDYNHYNTKLSNIFYASKNKEDIQDSKYKITEIDNPNGWSLNEIEHLAEMGFIIEDDHTFTTEIESLNLSEIEESQDNQVVEIYKTDEGYVMKTKRKYVFETFNKLIEFIENTETDLNI